MMEVSVLVPWRNDKRIFDLIRALENQTLKDFELIIGDGSDKKVDIQAKIKIVHLFMPNTTIAERLHEMARHAGSSRIAVTESDCVPGPRWLEELVSEYVDDNTIILGPQVELGVPDYFCYANLLVPRKLFDIPHDPSLKLADDTDWFFRLQERGVKYKRPFKAVNYHYKNPVKRQMRLPKYSREFAYSYLKHGRNRRLIRATGYFALTGFFSTITAVLMSLFGVYYTIKFKLTGR